MSESMAVKFSNDISKERAHEEALMMDLISDCDGPPVGATELSFRIPKTRKGLVINSTDGSLEPPIVDVPYGGEQGTTEVVFKAPLPTEVEIVPINPAPPEAIQTGFSDSIPAEPVVFTDFYPRIIPFKPKA